MTCTVRQRERVRSAARELRALDSVVGVDVLEPTESPHGRWSISLVTSGHLQPAAAERLAANGLDLASFAPQGAGFEGMAVA